MLRIKMAICANLCAILLTATCILAQQQQLFRKPWPTYSLQNMPQTRFTCHDKILGGYYADAETQCQMFHVCVKVAGVGVQDFRFLCPNGTAFEQEAQICADWGDVDCEQSVLYYGSDNFDLYRIGSGFESKRAPLAEEEEATFHLQRAESADVRRSKETRIDQKSRPDQPPNYTKKFEATSRNSFNNYASPNVNARNQHHQQPQQQEQQQQKSSDVTKKPIVSYYTPTSTTTERYNDESKQDFDDIFKGSHSSHFFSNRNGGREDDSIDQPAAKSKSNDFADSGAKIETSSAGKVRVQPTRARRIHTSTTTATTRAYPTTSTLAPVPKNYGFTQAHKSTVAHYSITTSIPTTITTTTQTPTTSAVRHSHNNQHRFSFGVNDYQTQEYIQPTTYNPGNNAYRLQVSTTPKSAQPDRSSGKSSKQAFNALADTKSYSKPTASARKAQKLERTEQKFGPRNSSFVSQNEFTDFSKIKTQQPQPFQVSQTQRGTEKATAAGNVRGQAAGKEEVEPQFFRARSQHIQQARVGKEEPAPFSNAARQRGSTAEKSKSNTDVSPRGFVSRGSINYKATTQRNGDDYEFNYSSVKKFSTLVPKQVPTATTFKPTTYKKAFEQNYYQTQSTVRPSQKPQAAAATASSTSLPATANPYLNADEDDGQYHPELYEADFPKNRFNLQRTRASTATPTTMTSTTTQKPVSHSQQYQSPQRHLKTQQQTSFQKQQEQAVDSSDEDELFNTAHSLNFGAASINKLRADIYKAEKTSQQYNSQYSPIVALSSPKTSDAPTSTTKSYSYSTTPTTTKLQTTTFLTTPITTTTTTTTRRPTTAINTTILPKVTPDTTRSYDVPKSNSKSKSTKSNKKGKKSRKSASKRPALADEDTSYDYAYYDTDTLSESPQEYSDYQIAEFSKTRKN